MFRLTKHYYTPKILKCLTRNITRPTSKIETTYAQQRRRVQLIQDNFAPSAYYGGRHTVTCINGNGIGPELITCVKKIFSYCGAPVDFEDVEISKDKDDNDELAYAITSVKRNGVCIKGNIETTSSQQSVLSRNVTIRNDLDLFINIAHIISYPKVPAKHSDIDIILMHQNTGGEYAQMEHELIPGVVESMRVSTADNCLRVMNYAFNYARYTNRKKISVLHKIHYLPIIDGIFLDSAYAVAAEYPDIYMEQVSINRICSKLVQNPGNFEIILMPNLYAPLVLNTLLGVAGGPGLYSSINMGDYYAIFEPASRNIGNSLAGKDLANPCAMINSAADMLEHLGHGRHAYLIRNALFQTLCVDQTHSFDLGGLATTSEIVDNIIKYL